jgi:hypothetical protein
MQRFEDQTVIIAGAARGMGASHARGFSAEGVNVVISDVLEEECGWLARELGDRVLFAPLDVTNEDQWDTTVHAAEEAFGQSRCSSTTPRSLGLERSSAATQRRGGAPSTSISPASTWHPGGGALDAQGRRRLDRERLLDSRLQRGAPVRPPTPRASGACAGLTQGRRARARPRQHPRQLSPHRARSYADSRPGPGPHSALERSTGRQARGGHPARPVPCLKRRELLDRLRVPRRRRSAPGPGAPPRAGRRLRGLSLECPRCCAARRTTRLALRGGPP